VSIHVDILHVEFYMSPQCGLNFVLHACRLYRESKMDFFSSRSQKLSMFNFWIHVERSTRRQCVLGVRRWNFWRYEHTYKLSHRWKRTFPPYRTCCFYSIHVQVYYVTWRLIVVRPS